MSDLARLEAADRLDAVVKRSQHLWWLMGPIWLIAIVDLLTGTPINNWRIDVAILAVLPLQIWSLYNLRRSARRVRQGTYHQRATAGAWVRAGTSAALSIVFTVGVGYLIGGWIGAVLLGAGFVVLSGVGIGLGLIRRRRLKARQT